jgi:hypothetical protein
MNSRERVIAAINHRQPDVTPMDLGGCGQTGMNASTVYKIREAFGLPRHPVRIVEPYQMLGEIDLDLLNITGGDVLPLWNPGTLLGINNLQNKPWQMGDGTPVLMPKDFEYDVTESGDVFVYPCGDRSADYGLHMPKNGFFFDNIERSPEFDEDNLTPLEDFRDSYGVHSQETCEYWESKSKSLFKETDYAIMGVLGGAGLGDVGELPGPFLTKPQGIRKIEDWLMAHLLYPEYIEQVFEYQTEIALKNLELYRQSVGDRIQVIWLSGTDFGTQNGPFTSIEVFRKLYKPHYKKINDWIHINTNWKTFYHTCGAVYSLLDDFIEMGIDIVNPVQCSAVGMDPQKLKAEYGDKLVFWGAGVDTQHTLPFGTKEDVRKEVLKRLEIFSPDGGFVFAAIHNIVAKVPVENLLEMYNTIREFRGL